MKDLKDYPCPICGEIPFQFPVFLTNCVVTCCASESHEDIIIKGRNEEKSLQKWIEYCERIKNAED